MIHLIFLTLISWSPGDSLRMETINGKQFIIHRVSEKETLYSISRRYGTPITAIMEFNDKAASGLETGQLLQVPYVPKSKTVVKDGSIHKVEPKETLFSISKLYGVSTDDIKQWNNLKDNSLSVGQELVIRKPATALKEPAQLPVTTSKTHIVEPKETLFSISKLYGVSVQQLKDWNNLSGNDVKVGQTLAVSDAVSGSPVLTDPVKKDPLPIVAVPVVVNEVTPTSTPTSVTISENARGTDEVKEGGVAELIDGTEGNRKYLALHRSVKVGSIIKVRNELNNREVFVRVVGSLPDTSVNDKIIVKISKSAYDRLGAIDPKFRVEVTYYK